MDAADVLDAVIGQVDAGGRAALCVIVATRGSTPQPVGTMVCVDASATVTGSLGGGCVEADVRRRAHQLLSAGHGELIGFALDDDFGYDDGMICGGAMDVAVAVCTGPGDVEPYREAVRRLRTGCPAVVPVAVQGPRSALAYRVRLEGAPKLVIAGAGHISRVLARTVLPLGFSVCVIDDRADYADPRRFPAPIRTMVGDIAAALRDHPIDASTYVVIVTRGHRHDEEALAAVLDSNARYIGMIGSRRKVAVIFDDLRRGGADGQRLERVHAPIGLDIGAITAEEIAVSIAAELIAVRRAEQIGPIVEGPIATGSDAAGTDRARDSVDTGGSGHSEGADCSDDRVDIGGVARDRTSDASPEER